MSHGTSPVPEIENDTSKNKEISYEIKITSPFNKEYISSPSQKINCVQIASHYSVSLNPQTKKSEPTSSLVDTIANVHSMVKENLWATQQGVAEAISTHQPPLIQ